MAQNCLVWVNPPHVWCQKYCVWAKKKHAGVCFLLHRLLYTFVTCLDSLLRLCSGIPPVCTVYTGNQWDSPNILYICIYFKMINNKVQSLFCKALQILRNVSTTITYNKFIVLKYSLCYIYSTFPSLKPQATTSFLSTISQLFFKISHKWNHIGQNIFMAAFFFS